MPNWRASALLRGLALATVVLPASASSLLARTDETIAAAGAARAKASPAFLATAHAVQPLQLAAKDAGVLPNQPGSVPCFLMKRDSQDPNAPCPCLTTPEPLVDIRSAEEAHVIAAVREAQAQGEEEIRAAVAGAGAPWAAQMRDSANPLVLDQRIGPQLKAMEQQQEQSTNSSFAAEEDRQGTVRQDLATEAAKEEEFGKQAIAKAAGTYAKMKAQNGIANVSAEAITQTFDEEQKVEAFKLEAEEFRQATLTAAQESLKVAREAEAAVSKAPKEELDKARAFIITMEKQAQVLKDEALKADGLSKKAEEVATEAHVIATGDLVKARKSQAQAALTLNMTRENARRLSALHSDAQRAEFQVQRIEY